MDKYDYSTIEHDFLHVKDYFSNYKFTYKERRSKLDFLLNISNEPAQDTSCLMASSKEQLVEVKNVYRKIDEEIRELSGLIYTEEDSLKRNREELERLTTLENSLQKEYEYLLDLHEKVLENDKLNEEFDNVEENINQLFNEIESKRSLIDPSILEEKKEEERKLKEVRNELAAKQRRLTIINTENYIEDIFYWQKEYLEILEKIFGVMAVTVSEDRCCLKVSKNDSKSVLEANIKGKKLLDCFISSEKDCDFPEIKEYALQINDLRPLLIYFAINC